MNKKAEQNSPSGANGKTVEVGLATPEQIAAWKTEHKEVTEVKVSVEDNELAVCYIRKPDRNITAKALSLYHQDKPLQSGEFIRDNCWIGGDPRTKSDEDIAMSVALACNQLVPLMEVVSKKL